MYFKFNIRVTSHWVSAIVVLLRMVCIVYKYLCLINKERPQLLCFWGSIESTGIHDLNLAWKKDNINKSLAEFKAITPNLYFEATI